MSGGGRGRGLRVDTKSYNDRRKREGRGANEMQDVDTVITSFEPEPASTCSLAPLHWTKQKVERKHRREANPRSTMSKASFVKVKSGHNW